MIREEACPKCGSNERIPNVRIVDFTEPHTRRRSLSVEIYDHPERLIFKGTHRGELVAVVCGHCGFTEMYIEKPSELLSAYRERPKS